MYLYFPSLSVGDDEVVNDALVGNLDRKGQRIEATLGATDEEGTHRLRGQDLHGYLSESEAEAIDEQFRGEKSILFVTSNMYMQYAYLDSPGWYHGADFNRFSSSSSAAASKIRLGCNREEILCAACMAEHDEDRIEDVDEEEDRSEKLLSCCCCIRHLLELDLCSIRNLLLMRALLFLIPPSRLLLVLRLLMRQVMLFGL
jgi:hypothetical protein